MNVYPRNDYGENFRHQDWNNPMDFPQNRPPYFGPPPAGQMPMSAPPTFSPSTPTWHGGSGGIHMCLFRNTYIWMNNGRNFWFFPTAVSREFIVGFRWSRRYGWHFRTISRDNIRSFECFR